MPSLPYAPLSPFSPGAPGYPGSPAGPGFPFSPIQNIIMFFEVSLYLKYNILPGNPIVPLSP